MIKETTMKAKEIGSATQQQKSATTQTVAAMKNIDEVTKGFVQSTQETVLSTSKLEGLVEEFKDTIIEV